MPLCVLGAMVLAPMSVSAQRSSHVELETADIAALATPAAVTILAIGRDGDTVSQGSGFVLRGDGVLLTNFHVLRGAANAVVVLSSGERYTRVHVLDADSALDLALLKIPAAGLTALASRTSTPRVGERVVAIGSPFGLSKTVTDGIVSATRMIGGRELIQISAPISPGSSGGAVLDASGKVFAVSTSQLRAGQALNFAVPVRYALGMLGDMPGETSIAEVFGAVESDDAESTERPASAKNAASESDPGMTRHPHPHASVDGTYGVRQVWVDSKGKTRLTQSGHLFATQHVGYLVLAKRQGDKFVGRTRAYDVTRWRTNAAGDLILVVGRVTFDGFQTADDGFFAYSKLYPKTDSALTLALGGVPERLPLSRNDGLFTAKSSSRWVKDGKSGAGRLKWTGELAVAFASDTIYVDLWLENATGGSTGFVGHGGLIDHKRFELSNAKGSTMKGWFSDGSFFAEFVDKRDSGTFVHTIEADRR
jgi:hypothetical protein